MSTPHKKIRIPMAQRLDDFRRGPLQLLIWGSVAVCTLFLLERQKVEFEILGIVRALESEVSVAVDGRLVEVFIEPFDDVLLGDEVARLDDSLLQAEIATALASIEDLSNQLDTQRAALQVQLDNETRTVRQRHEIELHRHLSELRRYKIDEEGHRLGKLAVEVHIEADLVERDRLDLDVRRTRELVDSGTSPPDELDDLQLRRGTIDATIRENRALAAGFEQSHQAAIARRVEFEENRPELPTDPSLAPFFASIRAETLRVEEIRIRRRAMVLRAPFAGRVTSVLAAAGQALLAGEPVAMITSPHADEVLAYQPEALRSPLHPGTRVLVSPRDDGTLVVAATVTRLGPAIEAIPERLWYDPAVPEYGRPFLCVGLGGLRLMPGEVALVKLAD